ncbi:MAG: hypothetical protein QOD30_39 [Actinomycetota bacterium]|jgi:hypothetical protein|nr:hypothetical protein [Actinomycetota bacterium]
MNTLVNHWTSADDVTPADLTAALRDSGVIDASTEVVSLEHEPVGLGVGIISLLWRLDVTYEPALAGPRTIILKLPHSVPEVRQAPVALRFYEREVGFYRNVATTTPIGTPRCYWSSFDPETHDFVLLLEDIGALDGCDQLRGCAIDDVRVAALAIARHHGACWERDDIVGATWTGPSNEPPMPQAIDQLLAERIPVYERRIGAELPTGTVEIARRIHANLDHILARFNRPPFTLLHGDFRADNLFFSPAPERELVAIDWQICTVGRAGYDLGYLMAQSVTTEDRRRAESALVAEYHAALLAGGATGYDLEDCWNDYRLTILWSLVYSVGVVTDEGMEPRALDLARTMATRSALAIADLDATEMFER